MDTKHFFSRYRKPLLAALLLVLAGISFYFFLLRNQAMAALVGQIFRILRPFVWGGALAFILTPVCNFFERLFTRALSPLMEKRPQARSWAHTGSCFATVLFFLLLIVLLLWLIVPQLYVSVLGLVNQIPAFSLSIYQRVQPLLGWLGVTESLTAMDWTHTGREIAQNLSQRLLSGGAAEIAASITNSLQGFFSLMTNLLVSVIVTFYCLNNRKRFSLQGKKLIYALFSQKWADEILYWVLFANRAFSGFVTGRIVDSAIIGCICFGGCVLIRIDYSLLIAVVVGVTNIIPFFGPFIGGIPSVFLILLTNPIKALYFVIFIVILQQFDGNILGPRILSSAVGVSGFWVLFSILLFGGLWGVLGMIVGTPLFAIFYAILRDWVNLKLRRRGLPTSPRSYLHRKGKQFSETEERSAPHAKES